MYSYKFWSLVLRNILQVVMTVHALHPQSLTGSFANLTSLSRPTIKKNNKQKFKGKKNPRTVCPSEKKRVGSVSHQIYQKQSNGMKEMLESKCHEIECFSASAYKKAVCAFSNKLLGGPCKDLTMVSHGSRLPPSKHESYHQFDQLFPQLDEPETILQTFKLKCK